MGSPCGIMVKVQDYSLDISEFKLQSCNYIHFWTNTLGKGMNFFISSAMSSILSLLFFNKDVFDIK